MTVVWAATDARSGRFRGIHQETDLDTLVTRYAALVSQDRGYLEVSTPARDFPMLTLSFRHGRAVVHQFESAEVCLLMEGDGSVDPDELVESPIMDEMASFTGEFVSTLPTAWAAVLKFAETGHPPTEAQWFQL